MKEKLWTGESVWCICGHHVEFHKTDARIMSVFGENQLYRHCKFKYKDRQDFECRCKEFTPYYKEKEIEK